MRARCNVGKPTPVCNGDARPRAIHPVPAHALSAEERQQILRIANEPRFAPLPPLASCPRWRTKGVYIASESGFNRVLRAYGQTRHRGRAKAPRRVRPPTTGPRQARTWEMSFLPTQVLGVWCYLYFIRNRVAMDAWSKATLWWSMCPLRDKWART